MQMTMLGWGENEKVGVRMGIMLFLLLHIGQVMGASNSRHMKEAKSKQEIMLPQAPPEASEDPLPTLALGLGLGSLGLTLLGLVLAFPVLTFMGLLLSIGTIGLVGWLRWGKKKRGKKLKWTFLASILSLIPTLGVLGLILFF